MSEVAIRTTNPCRRSAHVVGVDEVSLAAPEGSVYGCLGRNGAGKTTTIQMPMGLLLPDQGSIRAMGYDAFKQDVAMKRVVSYVPERMQMPDGMTVQGLMSFGAGLHPHWDQALTERLRARLELPADRTLDACRDCRRQLIVKGGFEDGAQPRHLDLHSGRALQLCTPEDPMFHQNSPGRLLGYCAMRFAQPEYLDVWAESCAANPGAPGHGAEARRADAGEAGGIGRPGREVVPQSRGATRSRGGACPHAPEEGCGCEDTPAHAADREVYQ